jgi:tetratricopeptide (TPR) repeat protein
MRTLGTKVLTAAAAFLLLSTASARRKDQPFPHGQVALSDGSFPLLLVQIEQICKGAIETTTFTGSEGRFRLLDDSSDCQVRAYLPGYRSQTVSNATDLGTLILRPRGKKESALQSQRYKDLSSNKMAWKAYLQGLDEAAKGKWRDAEASFRDVTVWFPWAAPPWLCLGMIQEVEGDPVAAKKSYKEAIKVEGDFALPYFLVGALEVPRGDWLEALSDSKKVIELDPQAYPGAWLTNAWANLNVHEMDTAEKAAREGLKLDDDHRFPELEYVLGLVLSDKGDMAGAKEHFKQYLALAPHGPRAAAARAEIEGQRQPAAQ